MVATYLYVCVCVTNVTLVVVLGSAPGGKGTDFTTVTTAAVKLGRQAGRSKHDLQKN